MRKFITISLTALAMLALPQAASAACTAGTSAGIQISVDIGQGSSPGYVVSGADQRMTYVATTCATPRDVTVQWVRVIDPSKNFMHDRDAYNRTTLVAEHSVGIVAGASRQSGAESWTTPAGTSDGYYGVIVRLYSSGSATSYAELLAANTFVIKQDVCQNVAGLQATVPAGLFQVGNDCVEDKCLNIGGVQTNVPSGLVLVGTSCVADKCLNIDGVQQTVPVGLVAVGTDCVEDKCLNLGGVQQSVPAGLSLVGTSCVEDKCLNIDGVQQTVPAGLVMVGTSCVEDKCLNIDGVQQTVPAGLVLVGTSCVEDKCLNIGGVQQTVPTDLNLVGTSCVADKCLNIDGVQQTVPADLDVVGTACVTDKCLNIDGVQTSVPNGLVMDGTACVEDKCDNMAGIQTDVPSGFTLVAGECKLKATPTGDPDPKGSLSITKVANRKTVKAGGKVAYTLRVRSNGPGTALNVVLCDKLPAGMTFVTASTGWYFHNGSVCWRLGNMAKGTAKMKSITLKVVKGHQGGLIVNKACVAGMNLSHGRKCATAPVRVIRKINQPTGGVTG